jgi:gluconokinase
VNDTRIILMGVAGCGKSSIGEALALRTGLRFVDGDDLHPTENITKMSQGQPLTDEDRWPWLALIGAELSEPGNIVGCSALKRVYRERIKAQAGGPVCFVHLVGSRAVIAQRMANRKGHFMPSTMLDSQFEALEPPEPDEFAFSVDIDQSIDAITGSIIAKLAGI